MGQSDDVEGDSYYTKHQDLCRQLKLDASVAAEAWKSYEDIRQHYTLEGDQFHWIGCALYVACRKTTTPTSGKGGANQSQGCHVSLTKLLQFYNLPLQEFFTKSTAWADMCNMPQDFRAGIDKLDRNCRVYSIIYQDKYLPIFNDIFKSSSENPSKSRRSKAALSTTQLFEFCWLLYICIKRRVPNISDDLVNSYHLLLVCFDLIYSNALQSNMRDLLNPEFPGLPENFNDEDFTPPEKANCIISLLCERYEAVSPLEACGIKEYCMKDYMTKFFNEKIIRGNIADFSGILEPPNFDANMKAINRAYDQYIHSVEDFDERIFLNSNNNFNTSPSKTPNNINLYENYRNSNSGSSFEFPTPLTGRKYLESKDCTNVVQVLNPTQSVIRLNTLLVGCQTGPSENLQKMFTKTSPEIQARIETKIEELGQKFYDTYSPQIADQTENPKFDFGKKRLQSAKILFYKLLELVLNQEISKKPDFDMTGLLNNLDFYQSLFACSCEIVLYSYQNKDKTFPWIIKTLNLEAYNFYRVIEVIIRVSVDKLTRDMVKHLSRIEEMILETLAWKSTSPLWIAIENCTEGVPSYEDVALPGTFDMQSPISGSPERVQSLQSGDAKKKLFVDTKTCGQSVLKPGKVNLVLNTIDDQANGKCNGPSASTPLKPRDPTRLRKLGSLGLFFRKFYNLTVTRLQNLCRALEIGEIEKQKIWTIFELSIKKCTLLMKDRHLDQILMSAVYVTCKLCRLDRNTFTEIMRCYRNQPQAESHIYRSVLISKNKNVPETAIENNNSKSNNKPPPTPSKMAATSHTYGSEERGDLIKFYNVIYVPEVKKYAEQFGVSQNNIRELMLSPLPKARPTSKVSPVRRVTNNIMTRTLDPKEIVASPAPQLQYLFNRSPSKDLETINKMVTAVEVRKKDGKRRILTDDIEDTPVKPDGEPVKKKIKPDSPETTFVTKKLENIEDDECFQNS